MGRIVVGMDGSKDAQAALAWALAQARATGDAVELVTAVRTEVIGVPGAFWPVESFEELEARAAEELDRAVATAGGAGEVTLTRRIEQGQPADVLLRAAEGAELLIVGSRGLGGFRGLVLGSVSQQCVSHARCPVVVLPQQDEASDG